MTTPPDISKIKIGSRYYALEVVSKQQSDRESLYGQCDKALAIIRVCFETDSSNVADTMLHELMHAVYWEWHIKGVDDEERTVTTLSRGLTTVFHDNPALTDWWRGLMQEGQPERLYYGS